MSRHISGHNAQRRMVIAVAAASMLLAVSEPLATADTGARNHGQTGGGQTGTNKVTSAIRHPLLNGPSGPSGIGSPTKHTEVRSNVQTNLVRTAGPDANLSSNNKFGRNTEPTHGSLANMLMGAVSGGKTSDASTLAGPQANGITANGALASNVSSAGDDTPGSDTDLMTSPTLNIFGLFSNTSFADPDDNEFIATVFTTGLFTDTLTSGADPALGLGMPGDDVNVLQSSVFPFLDSTIVVPVTDPFAGLFTALIPLGF